jgi:TolB-like protein
MADVFLSYCREDRQAAERVARRLEAEGISAWWDRELVAGEAWNETIRAELKAARAVVVLWSGASWASRWVQAEAHAGHERNVLAAARLDDVVLEPPFNIVQTVDLREEAGAGALIQGVRRILGNAPGASPVPSAAAVRRGLGALSRTQRRTLLAVAGAVAAIALGFLGFEAFGPFHRGATTPSSAAKPSPPADGVNTIAVLPFTNMSGDQTQDYFCDGISEEILNALVRLPELKVIGRTSSFSFKGKNADLRTIGQALGVEHLLEGSVRRQGERVRISAQLVRAGDGVELWSQSFDRDLSDILKVQEDIAEAIAVKLAGGVAPAVAARVVAPTTNGPAYDRYLEGEALSYKGDIESMERGIKELEQAVTLDPNLAPAWAALAERYGFQFLLNKSVSFAQAGARVAAARKRALELDPKSVRALLAIPAGLPDLTNNWADYEASIRNVLASSPNDITAIRAYGQVLFNSGRARESIPYAKRAHELDPLSSFATASYGYALYVGGGQRAEGKALIDQALSLNPMDFVPRFVRMEILLGEGNTAAAVEDQRFLLDHAAFDDNQRAFGARMIALAGDAKALRDHVAQGLELARAGKLHTDWMDLDRWALAAGDARLAGDAMLEEAERPETRFGFYWRWAPLFAPVRAQPPFKEILKMHKLPEYWLAHGWPDFCKPVGADDFECY